MFKLINNLILRIKTAHARFRAELELYNNNMEFYSNPDMDELYDSTPIQIFINGTTSDANNPRDILLGDCYYFAKYDYVTISFIKLYIFAALLETDGQGVEFTVAGDSWKIIQSRYYFKGLLKTG